MRRRRWFALPLAQMILLPLALNAQENGCVGDCDRGGSVTVEEIVRLTSIALGETPVASCPAGDSDNNGAVTVDEILRAIDAVLFGCELPDLVLDSAYAVYPVARGCNEPPVGDSGLRVCVANRGRAVAGAFRVRINDSDEYVVETLAAGATDCRLRPFPFSGSFDNTVDTDVDHEVRESDERNNRGYFSIAVLTATPSCTMAPVGTPTPPLTVR